MNSGFTSERVYHALKGRLLAGEFKPGERLDPAHLSGSLSSSVTPVRDVLNILRGEGLVETRTGEGFFRPHITVPDLEDLLTWSEHVLALAIRQWPARVPTTPGGTASEEQITDRTAALFLAIATLSGNLEHKRAVVSINDRLHAVRTIEELVLDGVDAELGAIAAAIDANEQRTAARLVAAYHRRRRRHASDFVRAVYRG